MLQLPITYSKLQSDKETQNENLLNFASFDQVSKKLEYNLKSTLKPHQIQAVERIVSSNGKLILADDMGLGKTLVAIAVAQYYNSHLRTPILVVCPKSMVATWQKETIKWCPHSLAKNNGSNITFLNSSTETFDPELKPPKLSIATYDMFSRIYENKDLRKLMKNCLLILDESHACKSPDTNKTKSCLYYARHVAKFVLLLSGTPALNRPIELFSQLEMVRPDIFPGMISSKQFSKRYCDEKVQTLNNGRKFLTNTGSSNEQELKVYLEAFCMLRRTKHDLVKLPVKIRRIKNLDSNVKSGDKELVKKMDEECANAKNSKKLRDAILEFYQKSAEIKLPVTVDYILKKLDSIGKGFLQL